MQFLVTGYDVEYGKMAAREAHVELGNKMRSERKVLFGVAIPDVSGKMICIFKSLSKTRNYSWLKLAKICSKYMKPNQIIRAAIFLEAVGHVHQSFSDNYFSLNINKLRSSRYSRKNWDSFLC